MFSNNPRLGRTSHSERGAAASYGTSGAAIYEEVSDGRRISEYQGVDSTRDQVQYVAHAFNNGVFIPNQPSSTVSRNKEEDALTRDMDSSTQLINFPQIPNHAEEGGAMAQMTRDQDVAHFNRPTNDLTRGQYRFRGVASYSKHDGTSKWQAWSPSGEHILNVFETEEQAAISFDLACIKQKGYQAITNYDIRYYDVQAMINGNTPRLPQMEAETCPVTALVQAYPHGINTNDDGYSNNIQPTIYHARGFRPAKEGLPNFVEILGLVKRENGSGLRFQHGDLSPFSIYQMQKVRKPAVGNTAFGLHAAASALQSYEQRETGDHQHSSFAPQAAQNAWSFPPYSFNFESEQRLNTVGLGFKHSSTSRFMVYKRNTMWKGKAKVNF